MEDRELLSLLFLFPFFLPHFHTHIFSKQQSITITSTATIRRRRRWREHPMSRFFWYLDKSDVQKRTMRSNRTSTTNDHHRRRLSIRNFLNDFRRQSSVHDYKLVGLMINSLSLFPFEIVWRNLRVRFYFFRELTSPMIEEKTQSELKRVLFFFLILFIFKSL